MRLICWPIDVPPGSMFSTTGYPSRPSRSDRSLSCVDLPLPSLPSNVIRRPRLIIYKMENSLQVFPCFPLRLLIVLPKKIRGVIGDHHRNVVPFVPFPSTLCDPEFIVQ